MKNLFFLLFTTVLFTNTLSAQALNTSKETKKIHQNSSEQKSEINQIDSLMTKSYERGLFNGNVLIAKIIKSSIKNHLVLPMKQNRLN